VKKTENHVVVGLGEILWDLLPTGKKLGGAPANFAYHAGMLGMESCIVSCIGQDPLGNEILSVLEELRLNTCYVAVSKENPTGTVSVTLSGAGIPDYTIHEGVAWDHIPTSPALLQLAQRTDAVCFGSLGQRCEHSRETIQIFLEHTRPECRRVFDINLRQSFYSETTIRGALSLANVLKLNDEELPILGAMLGLSGDTPDMLQQLIDKFQLQLVAVTRGGDGSIMASPSEMVEHVGLAVDVADTVGAGDAFTAALVAGLLAAHDLRTINDAANKLGAFVASQHGGTPSLPDNFKATLFPA